MKKKLKNFFRAIFFKKLIEEQKVIKIIKKAHRKEQNLLNRLLEENCDNEYITNKINELMKDEISEGINKLFPEQKVFFDMPIYEEENLEEEKIVTSDKFIDKKKSFFKFGKQTQEIEEQPLLISDCDDYQLEYEDTQEIPKEKEYWLINALNGYKNDKNRIPNYSTSVCLVKNGQITFSAVFDWYKKDVYFAVKGKGAYMNNKKIRVSQTKTMNDSIIAFRIGSRGLNDNVELQKALTPLTLTMQSFSNVALEMCFVACGKIDGCVDVAVVDLLNYKIGKLILEEAGGKVTNFSGEEFLDSDNILATNGYVHASILKTVKSKLVSSSIKKVWKITRTALRFVTAII